MTEDATSLDERQRRVLGALRERSEKLAGIYRSALNAFRMAPEKGCEAARVSIVCHCMRELMTGIPVLMAETAIPRPEPSSNSLMSRLPEVLNSHPELDLAVDQDLVPVPREVARAIHALVITRVLEDGRNRSNAASLITAGTDDRHPAIDQWTDAYGFFVSWAHLDRHYEGRALPVDDQIAQKIRVVEDVVEVRSAAFFENFRAVEDLLSKINAITEGDE